MRADRHFACFLLLIAGSILTTATGCGSTRMFLSSPSFSMDPPEEQGDAPIDTTDPSESEAATEAERSQRAMESMGIERYFLFMPSPYDPNTVVPNFMPVEEINFTSDDGTALHGWYVHHDDPRAVILYCHGNAGNLTHRAGLMRVMGEFVGASFFIFDYRGYGKSEGRPSEEGLYADARAARKRLADREGIDESDVVLMGRSLGGAVAAHLASEDGARALILESTFTSVPDMAKVMMPNLRVSGLIMNRFETIEKIGDYEGPLFMSHGTADRTIPYEQGRRLFAAANRPKTFVPIPDGDHNTPLPPAYYRRLGEFLDQLPPRNEPE